MPGLFVTHVTVHVVTGFITPHVVAELFVPSGRARMVAGALSQGVGRRGGMRMAGPASACSADMAVTHIAAVMSAASMPTARMSAASMSAGVATTTTTTMRAMGQRQGRNQYQSTDNPTQQRVSHGSCSADAVSKVNAYSVLLGYSKLCQLRTTGSRDEQSKS
jgi:hypothetical protein